MGWMTTAYCLLGQIYLWIFNAEQFGLDLKTLSTQLETASKQDGSLGAFMRKSLQFFSRADSVNFNSKLKKKEQKVQNCHKCKENVKQLKEELMFESQSKNPTDMDQYVLFELLKSLGRTEGFIDPSSTDAIKQLLNDFVKKQLKVKAFQDAMTYLLSVLQFFDINVLDDTIPDKQDALVNLIRSLPEVFYKCQEAIANKASAVETLRSSSEMILKATKKLSEMTYEAQRLLAQAVQSQTGRSGNQWDQREREESYGGSGVTVRRLSEEDNSEDGKLRMALLNVRSVKKKTIVKGNVIRNLILSNNLDFFLITETWLRPGPEGDAILRSLLPPNRNFIHQPRREGRGGGVAIVYSDQFICSSVTLPEIVSFECVAGSVQCSNWDRPMLIITIYNPPPDHSMFVNFIDEFNMLMNSITPQYSSVVFAGDFNIWVDDEGGVLLVSSIIC